MSDSFVRRSQCPGCGTASYRIIRSVGFADEKVWSFLASYYEGRIPKSKIESDDLRIARCDKCGLVFQEYILSESNMLLLYEDWISAEKSLRKKQSMSANLLEEYTSEIEGVCRLLGKPPREIRVLEYGAGWGFWSALAKDRGFDVTAVEISRVRADYAQRNGVRVIMDIAQAESDSVDYIYSDQVFEHIPDPKGTMQQLARVLRREGIIHTKVPNGRGIERGLRRSNWHAGKDAIHPLEHINCFRRKSLKVLAEQAGLLLRPPPYHLRVGGIRQLVRDHLRYVHDLYWSTRVYMTKAR